MANEALKNNYEIVPKPAPDGAYWIDTSTEPPTPRVKAGDDWEVFRGRVEDRDNNGVLNRVWDGERWTEPPSS